MATEICLRLQALRCLCRAAEIEHGAAQRQLLDLAIELEREALKSTAPKSSDQQPRQRSLRRQGRRASDNRSRHGAFSFA
jgi:hypothetical protein